MKLRIVLFGSAALCALAPFASAGDLRGTYFAFEGGASWVDGESLGRTLLFTAGGSTTSTFQADFDTGWALMGTLGYAFKNGFRAELEAGYRNNDIDTLLTSGGSPTIAVGELSEFSLMVNLLYDLKLGDRMTASIGAGIGADQASFEAAALAIDEDDWVFAFQGLLGLSYAVGDRSQIFLNYRYLHADAPDYTNFVTPPAAVQRLSFGDDLSKHAVTVGFRVGLDGEAPPPPAPPPAPPPPPPPPPPAVPKQFIVFFGFDRADLTPEAARVVADAADAAKRTGAAAITIIGHTDSSGSVHYNQRLSERRAQSVHKELVRLGMPASAITAGGQGESELIVKTGDGVKEPQNRRATIDLQ